MMKTFVYLIAAFLFINNSCTAHSFYRVEDTAKNIIDITIANNILTKGLSDVVLSDFYKDTMFLVNKDKFVIVDLKSGAISTNVKVNTFLAKQLKLNKYTKQIVVRGDYYYLSILNELYSISRDGEVLKIYTNYYFINDFEVMDNCILIASRDTIKVVSMKGKVLSSQSFGFTDAGFIRASGVICYSAIPEDSVYEFCLSNNLSVYLKIFAPISLTKVMEEPYISYSSDNYFFAFDYWKRSAVYVLKKDSTKSELMRKINLKGFKSAPTYAEMKREEGIPNFRIDYCNNTFYVISLVSGHIRVSSFIL